MINIPNKDQWEQMNEHLRTIAASLGAEMDVSTWKGIRNVVRTGFAPSVFPIGTQLKVNHSVYGEILCDVVAHDYYKCADDENARTMTLMSHNIVTSLSYDCPEAFYYNDTSASLPAGTYNFTLDSEYGSWTKGTYQFTLTTKVVQSGHLCISGNSGTPLTSLNVINYDLQINSVILESVPITSGNGGTSLGTFGMELNHAHRVAYGGDNYNESSIRKFLNSSKSSVASDWYTLDNRTTKYKRKPSWTESVAGFARGFDDEFLSCVGEVIIPCATNNVYESPDSIAKVGEKYTITDKFYLPSQKEIFGTSVNAVEDDSILFPFYEGATDADRIKYQNSIAKHWWTRSPRTMSATLTHVVLNTGALSNNTTTSDYGVVPCFTIV